MQTALVVSKALGKIHLQNYEENFHALLFSVACSQPALFNNRQDEKWKMILFVLHPLSYGPRAAKGHQKAVRKGGEKRVSTCHCPGTWHRTGLRDNCWDHLISSPPSCTFFLDYLKEPANSATYISGWMGLPPTITPKSKNCPQRETELPSPYGSRGDRI